MSNEQLLLDKAKEVRVIQVAKTTNPKQLAGSIAEEVRQGNDVSLHAIGHSAVGQGVKSVPIANGFLASHGIVLVILPSFEDKKIDAGNGEKVTRTVMRMRLVQLRQGA